MSRIDEIKIEIMPDGLVKITTDAVSEANHASADQAIRFLQNLLGGEATVQRNPNKRTHTHHHNHAHVHEHEH
jgi:hypothetical protein